MGNHKSQPQSMNARAMKLFQDDPEAGSTSSSSGHTDVLGHVESCRTLVKPTRRLSRLITSKSEAVYWHNVDADGSKLWTLVGVVFDLDFSSSWSSSHSLYQPAIAGISDLKPQD